jgi:cardiolipin synthase A/B
VGHCLAQAFKTSPEDGQESARLVHLFSIAAARKSIRLAHAYFVPDNLAVQSLLDARRRGVDIEIIVPARNDSSIGRAASRSRWRELADAGVRFYAYEPAMYHCKVMIVDDIWVSAGSVNFDDRSFRLNDEANFNVLNKAFAAAQINVFEDDKSKSHEITAADFKNRPWFQKVADHCAGILRSQL